MIGAKTDQPVFIVGCSRSGTTLLSVILDRHSEVAITPETAFYDEIAPKLPPANGSLESVLAAWRRLPELGLSVDAVISRCGLSPSARQLLKALLALYAEARSKQRCGEKTPQHLNHVPRIMKEFPESRVLCLIRDGRHVALSLRQMPWWQDGLAGAVELWLKAIEFSDAFTDQYPLNFKTVRYEQLVARPEVMMSEVMEFVGLEFEHAQLKATPSDVVLARSLAWKGKAVGSVEEGKNWQSIASPEEIAYLRRTLTPTLGRLGYPV